MTRVLEGGDGGGDAVDVDLSLPKAPLNSATYWEWTSARRRRGRGERHLTRVGIGPPACSLRSLARPSQNWARERLELSTVGELMGPFCQLWPMEVLRLSVPPIDRLWQELQEMAPDWRGADRSELLAQFDQLGVLDHGGWAGSG